MIRKIMLDIDGVCNQLIMHALAVNGCPVGIMDDAAWPCPGNYSVTDAANSWPRETPATAAAFWNNVTRAVWATTPVSPIFAELLAKCAELVGPANVCFLSSPTLDPDCLAGKLEWIQTKAPRWMHRQYLIGPRKHFCAHPETLLIDDSDSNVDEFRDHGGLAVLVPRPWNSRHPIADAANVVLVEIDRLAIAQAFVTVAARSHRSKSEANRVREIGGTLYA